MSKKQSVAFENGRAKALREIDERIAAKLGASVDHASNRVQNAAPRTAQERLGFGNRDEEAGKERQAFANAAKASQSGRGFFIATPAEVKKAMEASKVARADLQRVTIQNRQAAKRRLGLGKDSRPADSNPTYGWFDRREED